jgi:hypothetical protein
VVAEPHQGLEVAAAVVQASYLLVVSWYQEFDPATGW